MTRNPRATLSTYLPTLLWSALFAVVVCLRPSRIAELVFLAAYTWPLPIEQMDVSCHVQSVSACKPPV